MKNKNKSKQTVELAPSNPSPKTQPLEGDLASSLSGALPGSSMGLSDRRGDIRACLCPTRHGAPTAANPPPSDSSAGAPVRFGGHFYLTK